MMRTLIGQIAAGGPWFLGERFTAADVLWGNALTWTLAFKLVPEEPAILDYVARFNDRPIAQRGRIEDAELARQQEAARNAKTVG